jgi:hypothetical protein
VFDLFACTFGDQAERAGGGGVRLAGLGRPGGRLQLARSTGRRQRGRLLLRASQLWAPVPGNDPAGARACMHRFYALVKLSCGEPASPAQAAALELDWWRVHRQVPYATAPRGAGDEQVESVTRLYCYLYGEPEAAVRPAAEHRARAMDLSDQWVEEGCPPDSPLLAQEHAALVRAYAVSPAPPS